MSTEKNPFSKQCHILHNDSSYSVGGIRWKAHVGALSPDLTTRPDVSCFKNIVFNYRCSDSRWQHILFYAQLCIHCTKPHCTVLHLSTLQLLIETFRDLLCAWHFYFKVVPKRWLWSGPGLWCNFIKWLASQSCNATFIKQAIHSWTKWSKSFPVKWLQSHGDLFP